MEEHPSLILIPVFFAIYESFRHSAFDRSRKQVLLATGEEPLDLRSGCVGSVRGKGRGRGRSMLGKRGSSRGGELRVSTGQSNHGQWVETSRQGNDIDGGGGGVGVRDHKEDKKECSVLDVVQPTCTPLAREVSSSTLTVDATDHDMSAACPSSRPPAADMGVEQEKSRRHKGPSRRTPSARLKVLLARKLFSLESFGQEGSNKDVRRSESSDGSSDSDSGEDEDEDGMPISRRPPYRGMYTLAESELDDTESDGNGDDFDVPGAGETGGSAPVRMVIRLHRMFSQDAKPKRPVAAVPPEPQQQQARSITNQPSSGSMGERAVADIEAGMNCTRCEFGSGHVEDSCVGDGHCEVPGGLDNAAEVSDTLGPVEGHLQDMENEIESTV